MVALISLIVAAGLVALVAAAASSGGDEPEYTEEVYYKKDDPYTYEVPDSGYQVAPINSFYGNCHGGTLNGC
ncbi:MAG: hypothetical protein ACRERV_01200 [Methylococcales bacterium]